MASTPSTSRDWRGAGTTALGCPQRRVEACGRAPCVDAYTMSSSSSFLAHTHPLRACAWRAPHKRLCSFSSTCRRHVQVRCPDGRDTQWHARRSHNPAVGAALAQPWSSRDRRDRSGQNAGSHVRGHVIVRLHSTRGHDQQWAATAKGRERLLGISPREVAKRPTPACRLCAGGWVAQDGSCSRRCHFSGWPSSQRESA